MCHYLFRWLIAASLITALPLDGRSEEIIDVRTGSLGKSYRLIGPLGVPLGDSMTLKLKVVDKATKGAITELVEVHELNGVKMKEPVVLPAKLWEWGDIKELVPNATLVCRAYQDGGMLGLPQQMIEETKPIPHQNYSFVTWLVIYEVK